MKPEGWDVAFDDPVRLPGGKSLGTLRQARDYIARLSKAKRAEERWQLAALYLELAAKRDRAWRWFARSALHAAIHGDKAVPPKPRMTKEERWRALRAGARRRATR